MKYSIISTYWPSSGGVSTYTRYLFQELRKLDKNIYVIADKIKSKKEERVLRVWNNNLFFPIKMIENIIKHNINIIHIQFEISLYAGKFGLLLIPLLITMLKLFNKKVILTVHQVVNLNEITIDFLKENGYPKNVFLTKTMLHMLYLFFGRFADSLVVHEPKFKNYLINSGINKNKITVIKHGVLKIKLKNKKQAKRFVGVDNKYTFLYFGYLSGYKGVDLIIETLKEIKQEDFNFIIVGSLHPRLKKDLKYMEFYKKIQKEFNLDKRCIFFEHADEKDVNLFFRAADCLILPYKNQVSSSGPMALGLANNNLILGSSVFEGVIPDELLFKRDKIELKAIMQKAIKGKLDNKKEDLVKIKNECSWSKIAEETYKIYKEVGDHE